TRIRYTLTARPGCLAGVIHRAVSAHTPLREEKMQFQIVDTEAAYRRLLVAPDPASRFAIFREELAAPFAGLARIFGSDDVVAAFANWGMTPEMFEPERQAEMTAILDTLASADAWNRA